MVPLLSVEGCKMYVNVIPLHRYTKDERGRNQVKPAHDFPIVKTAWSPNRRRLISLGADGHLCMWDLMQPESDRHHLIGIVTTGIPIVLAVSDDGYCIAAFGSAIHMYVPKDRPPCPPIDFGEEDIAEFQWIGIDNLVARSATGTELLLAYDIHSQIWLTCPSMPNV